MNPHFVPNNVEEIDQRMQMVKFQHIIETMETIMPILFNQIEVAGFNIDEDDESFSNIKDGALVIESVRSFLCKCQGIDHPFQTIADAVFEKKDETTYKIVDKMDVVLKQDAMEEEGIS
jgi:hypothetical protein